MNYKEKVLDILSKIEKSPIAGKVTMFTAQFVRDILESIPFVEQPKVTVDLKQYGSGSN